MKTERAPVPPPHASALVSGLCLPCDISVEVALLAPHSRGQWDHAEGLSLTASPWPLLWADWASPAASLIQ